MKAAFSLRPVANEIARQIRAGPVLQLDDTPIKVMRPGPGGERIKLRQSQLWVFVNPEVPGVAFRFSEGRSAKDQACLLRCEDADAVDVIEGDGLETSRAGAREAGMEVRHAGCWAHLLRKFRDALPESPHLAKTYMDEIAEVYAVERSGRDQDLGADALLELRREKARPIMVRLLRSIPATLAQVSLGGTIATALKYARNQRRALLTAARDGRVPIDNNPCERAIRPVAIGRGNWGVCGEHRGGGERRCDLHDRRERQGRRGGSARLPRGAALKTGQLPGRQGRRPGALVPWRMVGELPGYRTRAVDRA